jgi:hypothetical protein
MVPHTYYIVAGQSNQAPKDIEIPVSAGETSKPAKRKAAKAPKPAANKAPVKKPKTKNETVK